MYFQKGQREHLIWAIVLLVCAVGFGVWVNPIMGFSFAFLSVAEFSQYVRHIGDCGSANRTVRRIQLWSLPLFPILAFGSFLIEKFFGHEGLLSRFAMPAMGIVLLTTLIIIPAIFMSHVLYRAVLRARREAK